MSDVVKQRTPQFINASPPLNTLVSWITDGYALNSKYEAGKESEAMTNDMVKLSSLSMFTEALNTSLSELRTRMVVTTVINTMMRGRKISFEEDGVNHPLTLPNT